MLLDYLTGALAFDYRMKDDLMVSILAGHGPHICLLLTITAAGGLGGAPMSPTNLTKIIQETS
jgi:hypothetical protein